MWRFRLLLHQVSTGRLASGPTHRCLYVQGDHGCLLVSVPTLHHSWSLSSPCFYPDSIPETVRNPEKGKLEWIAWVVDSNPMKYPGFNALGKCFVDILDKVGNKSVEMSTKNSRITDDEGTSNRRTPAPQAQLLERNHTVAGRTDEVDVEKGFNSINVVRSNHRRNNRPLLFLDWRWCQRHKPHKMRVTIRADPRMR